VSVVLILDLFLLRPVTVSSNAQGVSPTLTTPDSDSDNY
jgi:hypothetical protein